VKPKVDAEKCQLKGELRRNIPLRQKPVIDLFGFAARINPCPFKTCTLNGFSAARQARSDELKAASA
jgi:hypothetical protein